MSSIKDLKENLKNLSVTIRAKKQELKEYQRDHGGYDGGFYKEVSDLAWEYRHKHIAYSLFRGNSYEDIEKPRKGNEPNMGLIQEITDAYTENVCACTPGS